MSDLILTSTQNAVTTITLNSPQTRNALSMDLMGALRDELAAIGEDTSVHAVVLAAEGPVFSSGHNLKEVRGAELERQQEIFDLCTDLMLTIRRIPQPVIARVQGLATAAGAQLATTCDLVVAATSAQFATPGVKIGLFCSTPMVALTRAVGQKVAMRMLLTGDPIDAEQAHAAGLVTEVADDLDAAVGALAARIAQASPLVVGIGKEAFYHQAAMSTPDAYAYAREVMADNATRADAQEGMDAFVSKRTPTWTGR